MNTESEIDRLEKILNSEDPTPVRITPDGKVVPMHQDEFNLTRDDLLILLIEECSEVIQAATKCQRFGWDREYLDYGVNHKVLASEVGDLLAVIDGLHLHSDSLNRSKEAKIEKAVKSKALYGVA